MEGWIKLLSFSWSTNNLHPQYLPIHQKWHQFFQRFEKCFKLRTSSTLLKTIKNNVSYGSIFNNIYLIPEIILEFNYIWRPIEGMWCLNHFYRSLWLTTINSNRYKTNEIINNFKCDRIVNVLHVLSV